MGAVVADARRFADMHALYRMYDERGKLLYVGITGDAGQRFGEHSLKRWFPLVAEIKLEWLPHEAAARLAERRAISTERPRYNKAGVKPPRAAPGKGGSVIPIASAAPRDLLADLDAALTAQGVRTTNSKNIPRLDPADLRKVSRRKPG